MTTTAQRNGASADIQPIHLTRLERAIVEIPIVGETPLIMHNWSEKSKRMMLDSQTGKARQKKAPKNPVEEFEAAKYLMEDGSLGFPATAFKAAITSAAKHFDGVTMTQLKEAVRVLGDGPDQLIPLDGECRMREDTPRNATGVADLRYRPEIWPWGAVLRIQYIAAVLTLDSLIALVDAGGNGGVGDWRPSAPKSRTGTFGCFRVAEESM